MPRYKSFPKIQLHKFLQIKNSKPHSKSNVEILRKDVNSDTYGQTIQALDDPCVIYGITS